MTAPQTDPNRILILTPHGRDSVVAAALLAEAGITSTVCADVAQLSGGMRSDPGAVLVVEESLRNADLSDIYAWLGGQPPWSDLPFVVLTARGGGPERNPAALRLSQTLGNVSFLERPFHPTTLISALQVALRGRNRQYEARERIETIRAAEEALREANTTLEQRVEDRTARLLETEAALRQAQKLEAIGQLTGGIAHDFNNLLLVISGGLEVMDRQKDPDRRGRIVDGMRQAADRGARLTKQLLAFSRHQALKAEPVDLVAHVEGMRTLLDHALAGDVTVDTDMPGDLWPIEVDPTELELVILNLCVNARDAMPGGGRIRIHATNVVGGCKGDGDCVRLVISDPGVGMSEQLRSRVFEPFFTTKDIGKGSGLGLAQVYGFAQQSGGSVSIDSEVGVGTSVILCLPRSDRAPARAAHPAAQAAAPFGEGQWILVVEDDDEVAALVTEMLGQLGFGCTRVASADAALGALADGRRIDAVFSDVMMPGGVDGVELARELRDRRPDLPIVLTSGYADAFAPQAAAQGLTLLPKPYSSADLATVLNEAMNGVGSSQEPTDQQVRKRHV